VARRPDKTAAALRDHLEERASVSVSRPTVTRARSRLCLSRKKTLAATERNNYKRGWYWRRVRGLNHRRLVFFDESAVNTAMTPTHGRAPRGERIHDSVPRSDGEQTSIVGALSFGRGLIAVMTLTGAVDTLAFDAYLLRVLAPRLRKGDVVVLDNLNVHKASQVEKVAEARGAR
jgi:hypothetical protein